MKRAVIYTRVSRDDSGEGRSNERQEESCRALCSLREWEVVGVEADISISATEGKMRPGWERVLEMIRRGEVDVVVAWHIDRVTRNMLELEKLILLAEESRVGISTVSGDIDLTNDVGQMVARILAAVARAEVQRKGRRQSSANRQRAAEGKPHSHPRPFGYEDDRVTVREVEAEAYRKAADDVLAGKPISVITREWIAAGLSSSMSHKGKAPWNARGVRNALVSPRYAGIRTYNDDVMGDAAWPAIIDLETHLALRKLLEDPSRVRGQNRTGRTPNALLTGIATCSVCKETVRANTRRGVPTYRCGGSHVDVPREDADGIIISAMIFTIGGAWKGDFVSAGRKAGRDVSAAVEDVETLHKRLDDLSTAYAQGHLTISQLSSASAVLQEKLREAEDRSEQKIRRESAGARAWDRAREFADMGLHERRQVLRDVSAEIVMFPKEGRRGLGARDLMEASALKLDGMRVPLHSRGD